MGFFGSIGKALGAVPGMGAIGKGVAQVPGVGKIGGSLGLPGVKPAAPAAPAAPPVGAVGAPAVGGIQRPIGPLSVGARPKIVKGPNGISKVVSPPGTVFPNFASDGPRQSISINGANRQPTALGGLARDAGEAVGGAFGSPNGPLGFGQGTPGAAGGFAKPLPVGGPMAATPNLAAAPDLSGEIAAPKSLGGDAGLAAPGGGSLAAPDTAMAQGPTLAGGDASLAAGNAGLAALRASMGQNKKINPRSIRVRSIRAGRR